MSRLTRDGTAEPVSRDQILRHAKGQGNIIFPVQLTTSRIGNLTRLIHTLLYVMTIHTYIHTRAVFKRVLQCCTTVIEPTYSRIMDSCIKRILIAPVVQLVTSKPSDVGTRVRIPVQSHELRFFLTKKNSVTPELRWRNPV